MHLSMMGFVCLITLSNHFNFAVAWVAEKVRLEDVKTLTLYHGKMTTGRRSSVVPQIKCIGGSAGCMSFVPQVIQCYNRGSDGYDIQWECKTDMDNAFRFGRIEVLCEGYDYAEDPFVLKGSCGLEYTLDLTKEGMQAQAGHTYYKAENSYSYNEKNPKKSTVFGDILLMAIVLLLIYAIYRTCLRQNQYSPGEDDSDDPDNQRGTGFGFPSAPPPAGFRSGYNYDAGCGASGSGTRGRGGAGGPGFWTGAMAGGALGYLFGNNRNEGYQYGYREHDRRPRGFSFESGPSFSGSSSTGTRTSSGFGGTRRR